MADPKDRLIISRAEAKRLGLKYYFTGKACPRGHIGDRAIINWGCIACQREAVARWKVKNPEWGSLYHQRTKNTARHRARNKRSCKRNYEKKKAMYMAAVVARRALKISAMPSWADRKAINKIYRERERISKETGVIHHVDHIVPLQGREVCGLHVPWNLQIIPAPDNFIKYNRFDEKDGFASSVLTEGFV